MQQILFIELIKNTFEKYIFYLLPILIICLLMMTINFENLQICLSIILFDV